jgi:hypothetical protein
MKTHTDEQGSDAWRQARAGVITASMFRVACTRKKNGEYTEEAKKYAFRLAVERVGGTALDEGVQTWAMKRGKEMEPHARAAHSEAINKEVLPAGFYTSDDGWFGASPDGLIDDDGCAEYKALVSPEAIMSVLLDGDYSDYEHQVQGVMWVTGRTWCDFCMYCPQFASIGKQLHRRRVSYNPAFVDHMIGHLSVFNALVDEYKQKLAVAWNESPW